MNTLFKKKKDIIYFFESSKKILSKINFHIENFYHIF